MWLFRQLLGDFCTQFRANFFRCFWDEHFKNIFNSVSTVDLVFLIGNKYLRCRFKGLVFCRNNGWIMENMDKGLTVLKWVLIVWPKIPKMTQNLSTQLVWPNPKFPDFNEKRLHWASVVHASDVKSFLRKLSSLFALSLWIYLAKCAMGPKPFCSIIST